jgi:hypothetical protein
VSSDDGRPDPPRDTPPGLTPSACRALRAAEEEYHDLLVGELRRRGRLRPDLTGVDVQESAALAAQSMCRSRGRVSPLRGLDTGLIAIGSVGVGSMHPYLHSTWQIAVLVLFILVGLVGVGLMVRNGQPGGPVTDPSS